MSNNVRRLALDIGPWIWVYILFQLCVTLILDLFWLRHSQQTLPLMPAILLYTITVFMAQKVALWRTLPVSRIEIDRARWWQAIAVPALLLCVACAGVAMALGTLGVHHAKWSDIAFLVVAQSALSILAAGVQLFVFPLAAQMLGRWSAVLFIPFAIAIFRIALPVKQTSYDLHTVLLGMDAAGLVSAIALYMLAGHWPTPLTTALWAVPTKDRAPAKPQGQKAPRLRGWSSLAWTKLPAISLLWVSAVFIPLLMKWSLPAFDLSLMVWWICLAALQSSVSSLATAMRALRALPLSGWQLTCCLILLVVLVQAVSLIAFKVDLLVSGSHEYYSPAIYLLPLAISLVYLPFALRFGFRASRFGLPFMFLLIILPVQIFAPVTSAVAWIVVGAITVIAAGCVWTYWEITRGFGAYRIQPLVPARWRGL